MRKIAVFFAVICMFIMPVSAQSEDPYTAQYELSGADELKNALPGFLKLISSEM